MTTFQPYTDIIGTPQPGEYAPPTPRAAEHLIAGGWMAPKPCMHIIEPCDCSADVCRVLVCIVCEEKFAAGEGA